jgi:exosortase J
MTVKMDVAAPGSELAPGARSRLTRANAPLLWCAMALLAAAGCLGIHREIAELWTFWTTNPLLSIGMLIPPTAIVLTLRVWRQHGWEMRGTWWGLPVIGLAFLLSVLREKMLLIGLVGSVSIALQPVSLPVCVYGCGVVLLFAGTRVCRKAWFPLGLLLLSQPVPILSSQLIDIPLQNISARVARGFATLIGFAPTTPQLRLMFSPDFGMFIAPGCDGIRGAVTMGYLALVLGYLKRVSAPLWAAYVGGAVLLGYLFNFIRLCVLVLYYRVALGHPALEGVAKQADYAIGSCLFLTAVLLFLWLAQRKGKDEPPVGPTHLKTLRGSWNGWMKCAAFAMLLAAALSMFPSPLRSSPRTTITPASLAARMPQHVGEFTLTRTWYEQQSGMIVLEAGAYAAPGSDEIILGVSVAPNFNLHTANGCWLARGLAPDLLASRNYATGNGESVSLDTGFYSDGITDNVVVNAFCDPRSCSQFRRTTSSGRIGFLVLKPQMYELAGSQAHVVSIMVRIDKLHSSAQKQANYDLLSAEAQKFIAELDLLSLSRDFQ